MKLVVDEKVIVWKREWIDVPGETLDEAIENYFNNNYYTDSVEYLSGSEIPYNDDIKDGGPTTEIFEIDSDEPFYSA